MLIDITELTSREIILILTNYPRGKLVIKQDSIFWDSVDLDPVQRPNGAARNFDPRQPPRGSGDVGKRFERMSDVLGSMVG
jgi:hypothetical protein